MKSLRLHTRTRMHIMQIMQRLIHPNTTDLVNSARRKLGLNQKEFACYIGKSQGVVSRYESGAVEPPGEVIMHCMHILSATSSFSTGLGALDDLLQTLEGALSLVRSMRGMPLGLTQSDDNGDHSHRPRQA